MNNVVIISGTSSVLIQINGDSKRVPKNTLQCKFSDSSSKIVGFGYINQSQRLITIDLSRDSLDIDGSTSWSNAGEVDTALESVFFLDNFSEEIIKSTENYIYSLVKNNIKEYNKRLTDINISKADYEALTEYENRTYFIDDGSIYDGSTKIQEYNYVFGVNDVLVSTTGSDTTGDGSEGNPYASWEHALLQIPVSGGLTIWVEGGTYNPSNGASGYGQVQVNYTDEVVIKAKPNETVVIENNTAAYTIRYFNSSNVTFENVTCKLKAGNTAFFDARSSVSFSGMQVRDCIINNVDSLNVTSFINTGGSSNIEFKRNVINGGASNAGRMTIYNCENVTVIGNFYTSSYLLATAFYIGAGCYGSININNNTIRGNNEASGSVYAIRMTDDLATTTSTTININKNTIKTNTRAVNIKGTASGRHITLNILGNYITTDTSQYGIETQYGISGGQCKYNYISTGNLCIAFPDEIVETVGREVGNMDVQYNHFVSTNHSMLFGENSRENTMKNNICDSTNGMYAIVIKGREHYTENNLAYGGNLNTYLFKNCSGCESFNDVLLQRVSGGVAIEWDMGTSFNPFDNVINKALVECSKGEVFNTDDIGANNIVNYNTYYVHSDGQWGTVINPVSNLDEVKDEWLNNYPSSPTNDNKSSQL